MTTDLELTPVPGAEPTYDDDGRERVRILTCGTCGRSWNDAAVSDRTPAPSGRCPFEYEHADELEEPDELERRRDPFSHVEEAERHVYAALELAAAGSVAIERLSSALKELATARYLAGRAPAGAMLVDFVALVQEG